MVRCLACTQLSKGQNLPGDEPLPWLGSSSGRYKFCGAFGGYLLPLVALNLAHLALAAAEILALAAALSFRFLRGAAPRGGSASRILPSCASKVPIFSRIARARLSCLTDS